MAAVIGALRAVLSLDSAAFEQGLSNAQRTLRNFDKRMKAIGGGLAAAGATLSAVGTGVALAVRGQLDRADAFGELAEKLGVGVEALSKLDYAAKLTGVSQETLATSIRRLSGTMADAMAGNEAAQKQFADLGVSITDASGQMRSADSVLADLSDAFAAMPDGAEKTALAVDMFGKSGADMLLMLNGGSAGLRALADEAAALGLVLDDKTVTAAGTFNETLDRIFAISEGLQMQLAAALAPTLQMIADKVLELANWFNSLSPEMKETIAQIAGIIVVAGPALVGLGLLAGSLSIIGAGFALLLSPIGLTIAAIGLVAYGAYLIYENWDGITAWFSAKWESVKQALRDKWEGIKSLFWDYQPAVIVYRHWDQIEAWFGDMMGRVSDAIAAGWEKVKAVAAGWAAEFMEFGRNIVDGLKAGVLEKWDAFVAWWDGLGRGMIDDFKENFDINSPSRVMQEVGGHITDGLRIGIEDGTGGVAGAMQGVADAVSGPGNSLQEAFRSFGSEAKNIFKGLVTGAMTLSDAVGRIGQKLLDMALDGIFNSLFGGLFGGLFGTGGAFAGGVQFFADGGVVNGATPFAMRGGIGVMGEAGPEAIMPLTRGPGGRLGVEAVGATGVDVRVTVESSEDLRVVARTEGRAGGTEAATGFAQRAQQQQRRG